jgi:ABC-type molybdate transport system substrate-binding protein
MFIRWAGALSGAVIWATGPAAVAGPRPAQTVTIHAAGSLKTFVTSLAEEKGSLAGLNFKPTFGAAGLLPAKIEAGAKADLFLSAGEHDNSLEWIQTKLEICST